MKANNVAIYDLYQIALFKNSDGSPEGCLTATGELGDKCFFRINLTIVCPKPKQPKRDLPLTRSEVNQLIEAISDTIISLEEKARR